MAIFCHRDRYAFKTRNSTFPYLWMLAISGVVLPPWATAQEVNNGAVTPPPEENKPRPAETLVVTASEQPGDAPSETENTGRYTSGKTTSATGLALTARETPQAQSVITRQRIDDQQLNSIDDVLKNTTGISASALDSERISYYSRGFRIRNFQYDGIPSTPVFGDYVPGEGVLDTAFYDRVEVVRGAAGLLQGTGDPSASVNLVRKRPLWTPAISGSVSAGSWNDYRNVLDISTPLTKDDRVRARVIGVYEHKHGFQDHYKSERKSLYGVIEADLTLYTTLTIGHEHQSTDPKGIIWGGLPLFNSDGSHTDFGRSKSLAARWNHWGSRINTTFIRLDHQFDNGWNLKINADRKKTAVSSAMLTMAAGYPDRTTGMGMIPAFMDGGVRGRQNSVDVMASGPLMLFGREHELVVGSSVSNARADDNYQLSFSGLPSPGSIYDWQGHYPKPAWKDRPTTRTTIRQGGIYGAARISLADNLKLIAGARVSHYDIHDSAGGGYQYKKSARVSPYAGAVWDLNNTDSLYASYTEIFNPQTEYRDRNNHILSPSTGKNKEIGLKSAYFGGRVNTSLALFDTRLNNLAQIDSGHILPGGGQAYYSANGTRSRGIEADIQGEITTGWNLYAGISHFSASTGDHQRLNSQVPRTTARFFTTYHLPGNWNKVTVGGGVNWQSRFYQQAITPSGQTVKAGEGSFALASLMARYQISDNLSASVNINNLFDHKYYATAGFYNSFLYGEPRNVMVNLAYKL